jgi:hypothetical protein
MMQREHRDEVIGTVPATFLDEAIRLRLTANRHQVD